jgi:hypothetical protein
VSAPDEEITGPGEGGVGEAPAKITIEPPVSADTELETKSVVMGEHYRLRRFVITTACLFGFWLLSLAILKIETDPIFYFIVLLVPYGIILAFALRKPKALRKEKTIRDRLSFTNKLTLAILAFVAVYIPFTFVSNKIIPLAPLVEFGLFIAVLYLLFRLVGRSVGVAPSIEALPPANHRRHKQVVLPIDDPHYQKTLFLNYEFVDRGRGARTLAKRLESAMEAVGIDEPRRRRIVEDLEDYHEGFSLGLGLTRRSREKNRGRRDRRNQLLKTVYNKFTLELENRA